MMAVKANCFGGVLALPFPSCMALDKLLDLSVLQFPHYYKGDTDSLYCIGLP